MSSPAFVTLETRSDGVAILTLENPPLNLNTLTTLSKLKDACARIQDDVGIRVLVVTGSGTRAFCAGSDIKEFADVREDVVPGNSQLKTKHSRQSSSSRFRSLRR